MDIIIATFRRLNRQISLNNFPEKYKSKACLVVQPQEEEEARKLAEAKAAEEARARGDLKELERLEGIARAAADEAAKLRENAELMAASAQKALLDMKVDKVE